MNNIFLLQFKKKDKELLETQLAKSAKQGDSEAFTKLYMIHKVYLYKIAYSYVKDEDKALDILQECAYRGFLKIDKLRNTEFFKSWITKILINVAIDYLKKDSKVIYLEDETTIVSEEKSISIEERIDLYNAIDKLKEKHKTVIILKYFNDFTINEISEITNIPANTVKSNLRRAKEYLNKFLKEELI